MGMGRGSSVYSELKGTINTPISVRIGLAPPPGGNMRERRGNGSQPQAKYCSGASTGLFLDHRAFLGNHPSPGEAEGGCLQLPGWEELGQLWMCKLPRGGGGWLRDCSEGSWAPPERTLPKTMGGRPTEELRQGSQRSLRQGIRQKILVGVSERTSTSLKNH